jgi:hypothetical protein
MRIFITTTAWNSDNAPYARSNFQRIQRAAESDTVHRHGLVSSPDHADAILHVGARSRFQFDVLASSWRHTHSDKCFVFDFEDVALPSMPGLYMGYPARWANCEVVQTGFYPRVFDNNLIDDAVRSTHPDLL